ncbi:hypothetical protein [Microbacterium sp.]|uniref:hypothetical protein n=1 Tax=Microbacterium sp. TaxID=51671 RepID=UPI002811A680|nr:hypothetical protein [Microbacterium sp.]
MGTFKPIFESLSEAALRGARHADVKLPQLARNHSDQLDDWITRIRDEDRFDGRPDLADRPDAHAPDGAVSRGWLKNRRLRRGSRTDGGWHFLPEKDRAAAGDVPAYPGEYVLDLHGAPHAVQGGDGSMMDAAEFAEHLQKHTDWDGKSPIRLFSCDTGSAPDGFAQQLADRLGVDVTAPTKPVWSTAGGSPFVTDIDPITGAPVWPPNGAWVRFEPNG